MKQMWSSVLSSKCIPTGPQVVSRPVTKSLTRETNSIVLVDDADKVKEKEGAEATNRNDAKSRVALHLFESQSAPPLSSNSLGNVGGWQRAVESGAAAIDVDEDGRVIVPEDGLYLLYAQECFSYRIQPLARSDRALNSGS